MDKLKYLTAFLVIYIIFRIVFFMLNKSQAETYTEFTNNLKILYENLTGTSSPSASKNTSINSPSGSISLKSLKSYLNSPSRTINIAVTLPSGVVTTMPCIGNCTNCVVTSLTPSGCYVSEKS